MKTGFSGQAFFNTLIRTRRHKRVKKQEPGSVTGFSAEQGFSCPV